MKTIESLPIKDRFWMPAEFERHSGCWMLFPERQDNWRLGAVPAQREFSDIAIAISAFEKVRVGVKKQQIEIARRLLPAYIDIVEVNYDDIWVRDTGPTCVINGEGIVRGIDWEFNSWGGLFESWNNDNEIARIILEKEGIDRYKAGIVLEGGAIHVDGQGTLITTEECILNKNRNPHLEKDGASIILKKYLGVEKIIWIPRGMRLDETGGHIDNLCCFVRPGVVALAWTDNKNDIQWDVYHEAYEILRSEKDARNRSLEIHKIIQPAPKYITIEESKGFGETLGTISRKAGDMLPASYLNFYIANDGIIMPSFNDPMDRIAQAKLESIFPEKKVISVNARELLLGGGAIHCVVQQIPAPSNHLNFSKKPNQGEQ